MINKEELNAIYNDFFHASTKNPLVSLKRVCTALNLGEDEAKRTIKNYLFSIYLKADEPETIFTNTTGLKLLHIHSIERKTIMPKITNDFPINEFIPVSEKNN